MFKSYKTKHYIFYFNKNSFAEKEIEYIANEQEKSFKLICDTLHISFNDIIEYYLLDSPDAVGEFFGNDEPCNGFAMIGENKIYAVYNETIQCIGPHEDCHIISSKINLSVSDFLLEGLAMFFDKTWWSIDNDVWVSYYKSKGLNDKISDLMILNTNDFYAIDCSITYPIAGSFTKFLLNQYGVVKYVDFYGAKNDALNTAFTRVYNQDIHDVERYFWDYIKTVFISKKEEEKMEELLKKSS